MSLHPVAAMLAVTQHPVPPERWVVWGVTDQRPVPLGGGGGQEPAAGPPPALTLKQLRSAHAQLGLRLLRFLLRHTWPPDATYELRYVVLHLQEGGVVRLARRIATSMEYLQACWRASAALPPGPAEDMLRHVQACMLDLPLTSETRQFKVQVYSRLGSVLERQSRPLEAMAAQVAGLDLPDMKNLPLPSWWQPTPPAARVQDIKLRWPDLHARLEQAWSAWDRDASHAALVLGHLQLCYRKLQLMQRPTAAMAGRILDFARQVLKASPDRKVDMLPLCNTMSRGSDWSVAVELYRVWLQYRPSVGVHMLLADVLEKNGEPAAALQELKGLERYRMEPLAQADVVWRRARCQAAAGHPVEAYGLAVRATEFYIDLHARHGTLAEVRLLGALQLLGGLAFLGPADTALQLLERARHMVEGAAAQQAVDEQRVAVLLAAGRQAEADALRRQSASPEPS